VRVRHGLSCKPLDLMIEIHVQRDRSSSRWSGASRRGDRTPPRRHGQSAGGACSSGRTFPRVTRAAFLTAGFAAVALSTVGCGGARPPQQEEAGHSGDSSARAEPRSSSTDAKPPRCPSGVGNCRRAQGRVIYVERVDPDGEGDAHLVLASPEGVTAPGVTVVDLEPSVRPARLPRPGDWVGAAGPVYRGSHGQRQIEATTIRLRRRNHLRARRGEGAREVAPPSAAHPRLRQWDRDEWLSRARRPTRDDIRELFERYEHPIRVSEDVGEDAEPTRLTGQSERPETVSRSPHEEPVGLH
jgi:hypothetical protein